MFIADRMDHIREVFQLGYSGRSHEVDADDVFISVAYEGAAYACAERDINQHQLLVEWLAWKETNPGHEAQIHVGLGWALAKTGTPWNQVKLLISETMHSRVLDGIGYYEGALRYRKSILLQEVSSLVANDDFPWYFQGIGRSLWYHTKGEVDGLLPLISKFSDEHYPWLWRGIGLASTYVGGMDEAMLENMQQAAGLYWDYWLQGKSLALASRTKAGTIR